MKYIKIIEKVKDIQDNIISPIQGIRDLVKLSYEYHVEKEDIFMSIRAIESETDHLPIKDTKIKLNKNYINKIKEEEKLYISDIAKLCNDILEKYQK
jgi:hypothetical protein